jgi:uncharacterized membrane protein YjfL (UPF0719 family)
MALMEEILSSGAGLAVTVVAAGLVSFLGVWLFEQATRGIDEWVELRDGNIAVGVVFAAIVLAVGIIVGPALQDPVITADVGRSRPIYELLVNAIGVAIALVIAVLAVGFAVWLFTRLTRDLDEWAELAKGNHAVAVLMAGVILAISLLTATSVDRIVRAITEAVFQN